MRIFVIIFIMMLAGVSCTAGQPYTNPNANMNKEGSESMMGTWHLPGGDISISEDDINQMIERLQYHPIYSNQEGYVTPIQLFMYGLIKYHHTYKVLLPPKVIAEGFVPLEKRLNEKNNYYASSWSKGIMSEFWLDYMSWKFDYSDPNFSSQGEILDDFMKYIEYRYEKDSEAIKKNSASWIDFLSMQTDVYVHNTQVMNEINQYDRQVQERNQIAQTKEDAYRTQLDAQWAIGQADYDLWKAQTFS